jgi:hypothetical protein
MFVIEKGVPIPKGRSIYPFGELESGDSFLCEVPPGQKPCKRAALIRSAANRFFEHNGGKGFIVRVVDEGVRCWAL